MTIVTRALEKLKEERARESEQRGENGEPQGAQASPQPRISSAESKLEVVESLTTPVIQIDRTALQASGLLPPEDAKSVLAEQYRIIKQEIIRYSAATKGQPGSAPSVLITSALPGDGKSFTSFSLALSMTSERDYDVLLMDVDVTKRHITKSIGMAEQPGLLDVLRDPTSKFSSVVYATSVARLYVIPAGSWSEDASELLASDRMRELMLALSMWHRRRLMVLDSSPVLLTPESRTLADMVGQIVVVVKAGATIQNNVKEAVNLVATPGRRVTLVLNQVRPSDLFDSFYGYRYGYGGNTPQGGTETVGSK